MTLTQILQKIKSTFYTKTEIDTSLSSKADASDLTTHTSNADIHVTSTDKATWNAKQGALSTAQLNACNSGITSTKVSSYDTHVANSDVHVTTSDKSTWNAKQNALTDTQLSACNSGITSDKVSQYDGYASSFLPLSGGNLTGNIINRSVDNENISIRGATNYTNGAYLALYGKDHSNNGRFAFGACNGTNSTSLIGKPTGELTWGGNQLAYAYNSTVTVGGFHVGAVLTSSGKIVSFVVPLNIHGSPTISLARLRIRSEGNYLFGSTGSSDVTTSYTFTSTIYNGALRIEVNFSSTDTKATNNSCIVVESIIKLTY